MTRAILGALITATTAILLTNQGCKSTGIGDPCVPDQEFNTDFSGFDERQVFVESKSFQCQTRLCLVNHFRGRVSCPYGQDAEGKPPADVPEGTAGRFGCFAYGNDPENEADAKDEFRVKPQLPGDLGNCVASQCQDRQAADSVYCSCRCADVNGRTDDGAVYCECAEGYACEQLVSSIGGDNEGLTGGYCVKNGTKFNVGANCGSSLDTNDARKCVQ